MRHEQAGFAPAERRGPDIAAGHEHDLGTVGCEGRFGERWAGVRRATRCERCKNGENQDGEKADSHACRHFTRAVGQLQTMYMPPFTSMVCPRILLAASPHRKRITPAMSSFVLNRPCGVCATTLSSICRVEKVAWKLLSTVPGEIALTRMPAGPNSRARPLVMQA